MNSQTLLLDRSEERLERVRIHQRNVMTLKVNVLEDMAAGEVRSEAVVRVRILSLYLAVSWLLR